MTARARLRAWIRVHRTYSPPGEHLATLGCPVPVGDRACNRPLGLLRWVLVGRCGQHGGTR